MASSIKWEGRNDPSRLRTAVQTAEAETRRREGEGLMFILEEDNSITVAIIAPEVVCHCCGFVDPDGQSNSGGLCAACRQGMGVG